MYIERLTGLFAATLPTGIILDVQGVGYGIEVPLSTLCQLPKVGSRISLWISTYVREDQLRLFGFRSYEDRQTFEVLLSLGGVGPKVALAVLSTLTLAALERSVNQNDTKILESVPGVGARMAEKIIVELRPKVQRLKAAQLLDLQESFVRQGAESFEPLVPEHEPVDPAAAREYLFEDLQSALENLGYKEKTIQPLLLKLRKESELTDFQDLMRHALRQLSQGNTVEKPKASQSSAAEKPKTPKAKPLGLSDDSVF